MGRITIATIADESEAKAVDAKAKKAGLSRSSFVRKVLGLSLKPVGRPSAASKAKHGAKKRKAS